jgi:hypothetical protein
MNKHGDKAVHPLREQDSLVSYVYTFLDSSKSTFSYHTLATMLLRRRILAAFLHYVSYALSDAREITFPPIAGLSEQQIFGGHEAIDISTGSAFAGLTTYANLPYVHCLAPEDEEVERYDIAILGAPFDTVGLTFFDMTSYVDSLSRRLKLAY